jgi:NAD+ synthetase
MTKTQNRVNDITKYLKQWNINNVVLGLSGGIDSAFVLQLLLEAKKDYDFDIHTMFFSHGLHDYEADPKIVSDYVKSLPVNHQYMDISGIIRATNLSDTDNSPNVKVDTQYAYALMYTMLFRKAQQVGGITFGTTNKDEFHIGWFGKSSDMVVDIQPIHDFHKFEIYESELTKNIPDSIVKKAPTGDLLTGKTDEEMFGCSYKEVANYIRYVENGFTNVVVPSKLKQLLETNKHKLVKPKNEFNPIFL